MLIVEWCKRKISTTKPNKRKRAKCILDGLARCQKLEPLIYGLCHEFDFLDCSHKIYLNKFCEIYGPGLEYINHTRVLHTANKFNNTIL